MSEDTTAALKRTPLHDVHVAAGARIVPFAGYAMPVQYPRGIIAEHQWTRENAGLFDVSHMGQAFVSGPGHETTARALEALLPGDVLNLKPGAIRYSMLTTDGGGIIDNLMITRSVSEADDGNLLLVVNAARKDVDYPHIEERLPAGVRLVPVTDRALIALQGPRAAEVMERHCPKAVELAFMTATSAGFDDIDCHVSRSGYTGEDGFEISVAASRAEALWAALASEPEVQPVGLGARDTLRLEAGLCLYGHDIDETTSPVEAGLTWAIGKRRRDEGGFPGYDRIRRELAEGPARLRVGLRPEGRAPAREGTQITVGGETVGTVTSGGFAPTVGAPVAMGYVAASHAATGTAVDLMVRGRALPATVADMPFTPHRYRRGK